MSKFEEFAKKLRPGQVYRRADLLSWSTSVDRHLKQALEAGLLTKPSGGLYSVPKKTAFGPAPAEDEKLISAFLKDSPFLVASPNTYNSLAGTTQLHNKTVVYNHKRHGTFRLGGRSYDFRMKHAFPRKLTREFVLVDLVNNVDQTGEDTEAVLQRVKGRLNDSDPARLDAAVRNYGSEKAKRFFTRAKADASERHGA